MNIKIYGIPTCPHCIKTEKFFKQHKIEYTFFDVITDKKARKEMTEKSNQKNVPVIDIDGKLVLGFNEEKLKKMLKI